jgi:hypothetical protein
MRDSNPKSEVSNLDDWPLLLSRHSSSIQDFGFEMGFRPISSFPYGVTDHPEYQLGLIRSGCE